MSTFQLRDFDLNHLTECLEETQHSDYPHAESVQKNVLVYDAAVMDDTPGLRAELFRALSTGPGVITIKGLVENHSVIDRASNIFSEIIEGEKARGQGSGDHFAKPGANDRIWNSFEKHCLADPDNFLEYYSNPVLDLICESWLGPAYQMTAQVNRVNPGGNAQKPHRDYHLGFMTAEQMRAYPASVHRLSPVLTLQGALAHVDMPLEAGPTMYLPHSQKWAEGYLYFSQAEVQDYFAQQMVQLPLKKGDGAFFNPALLHGAGHNTSKDIYRLGNLIQVSSAMGRPMEKVDSHAMVLAVRDLLKAKDWTTERKRVAVAMVAERYPFPNDLDVNPPVGGLAPASDYDRLLADVL